MQAQHMIVQLQQYQQQMQSLIAQRQQLELQIAELSSAIDALKDVKGEEVFKIVGPIMVKSGKSDVEKDLKELKENTEIRIKTIQKQEERVKEKMKELTEKITPFFRPGSPSVSG